MFDTGSPPAEKLRLRAIGLSARLTASDFNIIVEHEHVARMKVSLNLQAFDVHRHFAYAVRLSVTVDNLRGDLY